MHRIVSYIGVVSGAILVGSSAYAQPPAVLLEQVVDTNKPLEIYQTPIADDDRLFIVRQDGIISIFDNGSLLPTPFLDVSSLISTGGEQGLLDMAFHPQYGNGSDYFFINYTDTSGDTVVRRYEVSGVDSNVADTSTALNILTQDQDFANHNGGQIRFGADGYLYIAFGDGGSANDPNCRAQSDSTFLGKILRIDVDSGSPYSIPATNPFVGAGNPLDEIWAKGLRNPWRFSFDRTTNDMWIGDVGQGAREEIDFQPASSTGGENYGWKIMEGNNCTGNSSACTSPLPCNSPSFTDPVFDYPRAGDECAVTGGFVYRGSAIPALQGKYVYGDYCSGRIWCYDALEDVNTLLFDEDEAPDFLVSFGEDRAGELYVSYQELGNNRVMKLVPDPSGMGDWLEYEGF